MNPGDALSYLVGEEKSLRELLQDADVLPLLQGVVAAGAVSASLVDAAGEELWSAGAAGAGELLAGLPVVVEGEELATIELRGESRRAGALFPARGCCRSPSTRC